MSRLSNALNIDELAALARRRLPRGLYEYLDRGAEDEVTMRGNADSIKRVYLRQRVAVDVSARDASTSVLGIAIERGPTQLLVAGGVKRIDVDSALGEHPRHFERLAVGTIQDNPLQAQRPGGHAERRCKIG